MDNSYLNSQVTSIIKSLHGLFDEIGVPHHDRESREASLYAALSETLQSHLRLVNAEKNALAEEANKLITSIRQIHRAMDDGRRANEYDDLVVTYPLRVCVETLKQQHNMLQSQYEQEFEEIKKLVQAIQSYACNMEEGFVRTQLPSLTNPTYTFKITATSKQKLEVEFSRVYEEFTRRIATVKSLCADIVNLWAELGTPTHLIDRKIVEMCRENYDGHDIRMDAITTLRAKKQKLSDEKSVRERRIKEIHQQLQPLWEKFQQDEQEEQRFLQKNRGCSLEVMQNWETEMSRLTEVKKQHMHIFIEEARRMLQDMWDLLYFTDEEMYQFEPAWSSSNTEAVLRAHEMEIARLQKLADERGPILSLIERYQTLVNDKTSLEASSQDPSRLLAKGPRDPTRLLREEKMRKKIAKELPKIESDLVVALEEWEEEHGEVFKVHGESYLDTLIEKQRPSSRNQNSAAVVLKATAPKAAAAKVAPTPKSVPARPNSASGFRSVTKTPSTARTPIPRTMTKSPTPYNRQPLSNYTQNGLNSPERKTAVPIRTKTPSSTVGRSAGASMISKTPSSAGGTLRRMPAYMMAQQQAAQTGTNPLRLPPPKMRPLEPNAKENMPPPQSKFVGRNILDEMPSDDGSASPLCVTSPVETLLARRDRDHYLERLNFARPQLSSSASYDDMNRVPSLTSQASTLASSTSAVSSENWETFGEDSDYEPDVSSHYFDKLKAIKDKKSFNHYLGEQKNVRGIAPGTVREVAQNDDWEDETF
ncbi:hypothetical protein DRE_02325 [Drechslerella stenobrocha 248]|uniref:Anaphase spindle elongation protein 1 n=1 Tax=Drechslerella stenobrocha 248 TaxID=1043628 RepID=W7HVL4_9PEZI|nr:hypothetical protein DRE_02325 [Drechslerella stenobrocha 248]